MEYQLEIACFCLRTWNLSFFAIGFPYESTADDVYDDFIYLCYLLISLITETRNVTLGPISNYLALTSLVVRDS